MHYKKLIDIYEQELTKSPKDRLIRLSRESMRKELDHFKSLVPSINTMKSQNMLSYLGLAKLQWNNAQSEQEKKRAAINEKLEKIKERKRQLALESKTGFKKSSDEERKEKIRKLIADYINSSRDLTNSYNYKEAVAKLKEALELDSENEFNIEILTLIAKNCEYLNEYDFAMNYYQKALEYAKETKDSRLVEVMFDIALVNKGLFKIDKAKTQFEAIAINENYNYTFRAKAYLELGEIEEAKPDPENAIKAYEKALELAFGRNKELVSKSYYKLAMLYDDRGDTEKAIKYYQKNYSTTSDSRENKYYSASLTNLALIYIEQSNYKEASECLKLALQFDSEINDLENMYFSQKELGKLYAKIDRTSAIGYFKQALTSAELLKDTFKEALVYFEVSELYYDEEDDEKALMNLLNAKNVLKAPDDDMNVQRINSRIKDIKMRLDAVSFDLIVEKYEKQRN